MRTAIAAVLLTLFAAQTAFAQADSDEQELAAMRRKVRRLKIATGVTLGLAAPVIPAAVITSLVAFEKGMEGIGCAFSGIFGASPSHCPSGREVDRLVDASIGLGVVGGALLVSGIGIAIAHSVEKKRLARFERELDAERFEQRRRQLRDQRTFDQWQLEGVSLGPILRGGVAEGAIAQVGLRF